MSACPGRKGAVVLWGKGLATFHHEDTDISAYVGARGTRSALAYVVWVTNGDVYRVGFARVDGRDWQ